MTQNDKAGNDYWDHNWSQTDFPQLFDPNDHSLDNYVNLQLHEYFQKLINGRKEFSVLEIGCANSIWPIYFHRYFNADVYGLDYSKVGSEKSRNLLKYYHVPGKIYCENLFSPPTELLEKFDLVVSFGVVEHFEDTAHCLKSCSAFVKPGGLLLTLIPNIPSIIGFIQKFVDKEVYDVHVPLTKKNMIDAHQSATLELEHCDYFMSMNLNVVNSGSFSSHRLNPLLRRILSGISKVSWILEKCGIRIPKNRLTSPYIVSVAKI
ncbi:MAG: class I SAM-dependent methyltransferase [Candidatus Paracaedibacteraceae bacterium]|nr:class I SAM-dependent methyltransferase [Candidatus Paracaedibacteraceae bacterium]